MHLPDDALPAPEAALPPEIAFLVAERLVPDERLRQAARVAAGTGVTADCVLLADGTLTEEAFYHALARHLGLPFAEHPLRPAAAAGLGDALRRTVVELAPNPEAWRYLAAPRGPGLRAFLGVMAEPQRRPAAPVALTSPSRLEALMRYHCRRDVARSASHGLPDWNGALSARNGLSAIQGLALVTATFALTAAAFAAPTACSIALDVAFFVAFLLAVALRLLATAASPAPIEPAGLREPDAALPTYTLIVPLFREARVVKRLVQSLDALDYPGCKLEILLVVETNDAVTLEAIERLALPGRYRTIVAPPGRPQTKPRALNVALQFARGDLVVVYDAEDAPEPGQLRAAARRFAADPALACLQARLAIDNIEDNWLTRLFALDYAALFHVLNPGLAALRLPIPLGGTSNHFRAEALRRVNGWDAWNVTEDIDLGIRLARFGLRVGSLDSTTFEEAPNRLRAWLAQRTRWQKGWMVTFATHSRHPRRLWRDLGSLRTAAVVAILFGTVASCLLGPFFFAVLLLRLVDGALLSPATPVETALSVASGLLVMLGIVSAVWPILLGLRRRGLLRLAGSLALLPVYLLLLSIAAWQAAFEVLGRPYAWTKTEHGTAKRRLASSLPG